MAGFDAEELHLLRTTAQGVFAGGGDLAALGELGLLGLLTPESSGGDGWRVVEACTVAIEGGRALTPVPWSGSLVAAAALGGSVQDEIVLAALLGGGAPGAFLERPGACAVDGGWRVSGTYAVPAGVPPAVLVVASAGDAPLVVVDPADPHVRFASEEDALDTLRGGSVATLSAAPARALPTADKDALAAAATLLACADSLGALEAAAERMVRYLGERQAFGRPIASFQVIQHRLVNLDVLVAQADALVSAAAEALADHAPMARHLVGMAHAFLADRCTPALDDCIQLSGGIGFTWEWPVHHAMRRSLVNAAARVPGTPSAEELRRSLEVERPAVPGTEDFRKHVRSVISEHAPFPAREGHRAPTSRAEEAALRAWYRVLYEEGLLGASWPEEWGGRADHEQVHELVVTEELIRARAPRPIDQVILASHVLLRFGTPEQKQRYLPPIRTADDIWCQLFSEPDAGSDLAGVRTRALQQPDGSWVLTGQKIWSTDAHWSQFGLALVRTSVTEKRHDGLTVFVVPIDAPGVEVRPILSIGRTDEFNEVFLDGVVLGPEHVVGEVGRGWAVAMSGLEIERFGVGGNVVLLELLLKDVLRVAEELVGDGEPLLADSAVRAAVARLLGESEAARAFVTGHVGRLLSGREGEGEAAIAKIVYSEAFNRIARYGTELVSAYGPVPERAAQEARRLRDAWLWSRALTISGGSSEVMRNILAKRRLGLPSTR